MYTLYKFHFLNGISEINQLFDDILIIWPAPVYNMCAYSIVLKYLDYIVLIKNLNIFYLFIWNIIIIFSCLELSCLWLNPVDISLLLK